MDSLSLIVTLFVPLAIWQLSRRVYVQIQRNAFAKQNQCKPIAHYPHKDPILGLDVFIQDVKSMQNRTYIESLRNRFTRFGRTWQCTSFGQDWVFSMEPDNIQAVFSRDFEIWAAEPIRHLACKPFIGERSFFSVDGPVWRHARNQTKPALAKSEYTDFAGIESHFQRFLTLIPHDGSAFDIVPPLEKLLQDYGSQFFFGQSTETMTSSEHEGIIEALEVGQKITMDRIMLGQLVKVMPLQKSYRHACQVVNEFLDKRIDEAFRHEQKNEKSAINEPLVIINELVKETGDRAQIRDTLITLYVAGTHTTFIVVSNALFELARHPECLSKLQKELYEIGSHKPDLSTLQKMSYLKGVINEAMRLHPIAALNMRYASRDTVLPVGGGSDGSSPALVKKGSKFIAGYDAMYRDPKIWGSDADEFIPERWIDRPQPPHWAYVPFSGGPRVCPGQQLATANVRYLLVRLMQEFKDVQSRDDRPWVEDLGLAIKNVNGVHIALTPA